MTFRVGWLLLLVLCIPEPVFAVSGTENPSGIPRLEHSCGAILAKGADVTMGTLLPVELHYYPYWDFTIPKYDKGAKLNPGEQVWISDKSTHGLTCVATATQAGWMPSGQITGFSSTARETDNTTLKDSVGTWMRDKYTTLVIGRTVKDKLFLWSGDEMCEGACNHNAHAENFPGKYSGNGVWIFTKPLSPRASEMYRKRGAEPCKIRVRHIGQALYVGDNMMCGGLNGSFSGTYHEVGG